MSTRQTLDTSIRALGHPVSLGALGLLLLNDHYLKATYPSAFTGKLSDFAGLVFFPFLVAIVLAPLAKKAASRWVGRTAIALTGVWFIAIKTSTVAASATESLVEVFLSGSRIIVDPTDLVALLALGLSWRIWQLASELSPLHPSRTLLIAFFAAASIATSCEAPEPLVNITVSQGAVWDLTYSPRVLVDGEWRSVGADDAAWDLESIDRDGMQTLACLSDQPDHCFRIINEREIQESVGGDWSTVFAYPADRMDFAEREIATPCGTEETLAMSDIVILENPNPTVYVAAGTDLIVGNAEGTWEGGFERFERPGANIGWELNVLMAIAIAMFGLFAFVTVDRYTAGFGFAPQRRSITVGQVFFAAGALGVAAPPDDLFLVSLIAGIVCLVTLPAVLSPWLRRRKELLRSGMFDLTFFASAALPLVGAILAFQRFYAWSAGDVRTYAPAVWQAAGIEALVIAGFFGVLRAALGRRDASRVRLPKATADVSSGGEPTPQE